ncbi:MAG TPA: LCP family protein [Frankiaceae bacterium]|nr:LCP family protein [Frankiaceae bacterium]
MSDDPRYRRGYVSSGDETRDMPAPPQPASSRPRDEYLPLPPELSPRKKDRRGRVQPVGVGASGAPGSPEPPDDRPSVPPSVPPYGPGAGRPRGRRRFGWGKRLLTLLAVLLVLFVGLLLYWDGKLTRVDALGGYDGRPKSAGTNWLLIGSDSRAGLTDAQKKDLATGNAAGSRTDTIMLVHTGGHGTSLISLPRDSYLPIPGHGRDKLNAAFSLGGAKLLTRTVEEATGLRIDHFAQIGFGGFANMVNAVGGVNICVDKPINDPKAGLTLKAGCQKLDGAQALGYVRTRATANADLDRVKHQRQFLAALVSQSARPTVLLNPFRALPLGSNAVDSLTVDQGTHIWAVARLGLALRGLSGGKGVTSTVPIGSTGPVSGVGDVVHWDRTNAVRLFDALDRDQKVPADLIK